MPMVYLSSDNTFCGAILACASIAVPAWIRMLFFVKFDISSAMSVSLMRDSAACRFSEVVFRFLTVDSSLFC